MFTIHDAIKLLVKTHKNLENYNYPFNKELIIRTAKKSLNEYNYLEQEKTLMIVVEREWNTIFKNVIKNNKEI